MKQLKLIIILTTIFSILPSYAQVIGYYIQEVVLPTRIEMNTVNFFDDTQSYTTGGITFTYPSGWFTQPPMIQVTLQQNVSHATTLTYTAEVVSNSTTSTVVMVYEINAGVVSDAPTGVVTIIISAVDSF